MIKILYVLNNALNRGGTEAVVLNYYYALQNDPSIKIEFALHATKEEAEQSALTKEFIKSGGTVHLLTPRKVSVKQERRDLEALLLKEQYDIVHSHSDAIGAEVLRIARKCGVKIRIAHSHSTDFPIKPDSAKNALKWLYLNACRHRIRHEANYFMACSSSAANWLFGEKKGESTFILNNAIDIAKYKFSESTRKEKRSELGLEDQYVIGHVGRLSREKNHSYLLDVFAQVHKAHPNAVLLLVGDGELKGELQEKCKELGLEKNVIFYGSTNAVNEILNVFDVFAFPSRYEGLSVALIEAQANGLHCVVNDTEKIVKDVDLTGQLTWISLADKQKWVEALSEREYPRNSKAGEEITKHGFALDVEAKKLKQYYENAYHKANEENKKVTEM